MKIYTIAYIYVKYLDIHQIALISFTTLGNYGFDFTKSIKIPLLLKFDETAFGMCYLKINSYAYTKVTTYIWIR